MSAQTSTIFKNSQGLYSHETGHSLRCYAAPPLSYLLAFLLKVLFPHRYRFPAQDGLFPALMLEALDLTVKSLILPFVPLHLQEWTMMRRRIEGHLGQGGWRGGPGGEGG